ncbi:MAG: PfkB family carbohydrate kinase [Betaproteobacteria bacterium]
MTVSLICLGMCAQDAIYAVPAIPTFPTKVLATHFTECGGGMAANAAVAAARLGARVQYWGRVGDDPLGERITRELASEGVDIGRVRRVPGCLSPSAAILIDATGERLICAYNDPALDRDTSWLPLEVVDGVDAVLADVRWPQAAAVVLDRSREAGKVALLDADIGPVADLHDLIPRATHVVFSEGGLQTACGAMSPGAALRQLAPTARGLVGVTLGAEGFLWRDHGAEHRAPALPISAIDTLAAGDVWHAAFAIGLAETWPVDRAARFANVAAALKCERSGGRRGAPTRSEVIARLK